MAHLLRKLFMSSQQRKQINSLLSENAREFERIIEDIKETEREQKAIVMGQYAQDLLKQEDIEAKEVDIIEREAQRKCDRIADEAKQKICEARLNFEQRNSQIWSLL
ncbi:hypothetical protein IKG06_03125 [Candidatus Saccharibacteria bacterium]|nr:hypothetical protein [Candidatus Saccharibacteria bacterium]